MSTNLLSFCYFELVYRKRKKIYFCLFCFFLYVVFCYGNFHICEAKILSLRNFMVFFHGQTTPYLKIVKIFFLIQFWSYICGKVFYCVFLPCIVQLKDALLYYINRKGLFFHLPCRVAQFYYCN